MSDTTLRAYLLGELPAAEAESLEGRILDDHDLFEAVRAVEGDLFDEHVRGIMTAGERQRFIERFGDDTDRIAFAAALADRTGSRGRRAIKLWKPLALAAAVVLAVGGAYLARRSQPVAPASPSSVQASSARTAVIALTLGASRAAARETPAAWPRQTSTVEFRVRLNPADRFDRYAMELRSSDDRVVWRADNLRASLESDDLVVAGSAPAAAITGGTYELAVRSGADDLGFVTIKVTRTP